MSGLDYNQYYAERGNRKIWAGETVRQKTLSSPQSEDENNGTYTADLAICLALLSTVKDSAFPSDAVAIGEVTLSGTLEGPQRKTAFSGKPPRGLQKVSFLWGQRNRKVSSPSR